MLFFSGRENLNRRTLRQNTITVSSMDIKIYSNTIESRKFEDISQEELIKENNANLEMCKKYNQIKRRRK